MHPTHTVDLGSVATAALLDDHLLQQWHTPLFVAWLFPPTDTVDLQSEETGALLHSHEKRPRNMIFHARDTQGSGSAGT